MEERNYKLLSRIFFILFFISMGLNWYIITQKHNAEVEAWQTKNLLYAKEYKEQFPIIISNCNNTLLIGSKDETYEQDLITNNLTNSTDIVLYKPYECANANCIENKTYAVVNGCEVYGFNTEILMNRFSISERLIKNIN